MKKILAILTILTLAVAGTANFASADIYVSTENETFDVAILGDSYSAGNGAGMYYHHQYSFRSHRNWGNLYINWLKNRDVNAVSHNFAYSGNKTDQVLSLITNGSFIDDGNKITIQEKLPIDIDLVLMTIGGNDANFSSIVRNCLVVGYRGLECKNFVEDANKALDEGKIKSQTLKIFQELQKRLPEKAKVVLLGYPLLSLKDSTTVNQCTKFNHRQCLKREYYPASTEVRALGVKADTYQKDLVAEWNSKNKMKVEFVSVYEKFAGHEPIGNIFSRNPKRWINGILETEGKFENNETSAVFSTNELFFYHPNITGHEKMFEVLRDKIGNPAASQAVISSTFKNFTANIAKSLSNFGEIFPSNKAYANENSTNSSEFEKYIEQSDYIPIDGNLIAKEDVGAYIFINYGSLENYKNHLRQNGEEIVKIGNKDLIDIFEADVEKAQQEFLAEDNQDKSDDSSSKISSQEATPSVGKSESAKISTSENSSAATQSAPKSQPEISHDATSAPSSINENSSKTDTNTTSNSENSTKASSSEPNPSEKSQSTSSNNAPFLVFGIASGAVLAIIASFLALKKR